MAETQQTKEVLQCAAAMEDYARRRNFPVANRLAGVFPETRARMTGARRE